mgnify:CR=1 FL=1|jgi:hypothetical protein
MYFGERVRDNEDDELFSIAGMGWENLDYELLTANGLDLKIDGENSRSDDFAIWSYWEKDGWLWKVNWLEDNDVFCWHVNTAAVNKQRAIEIGNIKMPQIIELFDNGKRPFDTIR